METPYGRIRGQLLIKGVELSGGLRDYALALQQRDENEIEYLRVYIPSHAAFGNDKEVNKSLKRLRCLLGLDLASGSKKKDEWMDDPALAKQGMDFLKKLNVVIGKV